MSNETWSCPGVDDNGFIAYESLQKRARNSNREDFAEAHPVPALLVVYRDPESLKSGTIDPSSEGVQLLTVSIKSASILRFLNRVAFLCKRPGNPYAHLISIGRSPSNDISIGVDSVSKVHGYFAREDAEWCFTDHSSTNGSLLNDEPVRSGQKNTLHDGDVLQLGLEVSLEFFTPKRLYDHLTKR